MASNPRRYRQLRQHILATRPPVCAWCGHPIDLTLSGNHPQGPTTDHIVPRALGGKDHASNLQPMHRRCNTIRGIGQMPNRNSRHW